MKAILVIDMPTDCIKCPLADGYCWNTFPTKGKADGCPLRPLPQKMTMEKALKMERVGAIRDIYTTWDACLAEITGVNE